VRLSYRASERIQNARVLPGVGLAAQLAIELAAIAAGKLQHTRYPERVQIGFNRAAYTHKVT